MILSQIFPNIGIIKITAVVFKAIAAPQWHLSFLKIFPTDWIGFLLVLPVVVASRLLIWSFFIGIILKLLEEQIRDKAMLGTSHLEGFMQKWSKYDPRGKGIIKAKQLLPLLLSCDPPLGLGSKCCLSTIFPVTKNSVFFKDI